MQFHSELILIPETPNLRIRSKDLNFLFANISEEDFVSIYDESVGFVRKHFGRKLITGIHKSIDDEAYFHLTREIALHWMYYYNVNRLKIRLTKGDLTHPQTYEIVMKLSERLSEDKTESHKIAAAILGITLKKYEEWLEGFLRWVEMW